MLPFWYCITENLERLTQFFFIALMTKIRTLSFFQILGPHTGAVLLLSINKIGVVQKFVIKILKQHLTLFGLGTRKKFNSFSKKEIQ
jgi:hypothetical protein